jgi:tRNA G10  N-methylase Trm11
LGKLKACTGDVLDLPLPIESVDAIVTSPPYSFAIYYLENDRPQLEFLGFDIDELKTKTIGLRGEDKAEKIKNYFVAMNKAIEEMSRVLKSGKFCVIVVGSNEIQTGGIKLEKEFCTFAEDHNMMLRRDLVKSIQGIQNSMREEHVLFFQKQ